MTNNREGEVLIGNPFELNSETVPINRTRFKKKISFTGEKSFLGD